MKINKDKATVILPVYNSSKHIKEALESIKKQTFSEFECLVINDGSTDNSAEVIKKTIKNDRRFTLINHKNNMGLISTLNEGVRLSKGKYIIRMDADDISAMNRFSKQIDYMENNPKIDISGTWVQVFGKHNYIWKTAPNHDLIVSKMIFECPLAHPSIIMRKASISKHDLKYPKKYKHAEDYALWAEGTDKYTYSNIPEVLLNYRTHKVQVGESQKIEQETSSQKVRLNLVSKLLLPNMEEKNIHRKLSSWVPLSTYKEIYIMWLWLFRLHNSNSKLNRYDKKSFNEILATRLFIELLISHSISFIKWIALVMSPYAYITAIRIVLYKFAPNYFRIYI